MNTSEGLSEMVVFDARGVVDDDPVVVLTS
jgi:hypothetical protein